MNDSSTSPLQTVPRAPDGAFYFRGKLFRYPALATRFQALFIDVMLMLTVMVTAMVWLHRSPYRQPLMISLGVFFVLVYEPVFSVYACTLGQRLMRIRVRSIANPNERINLVHAYVRVIVKFLLGWVSFVTIHYNPEHRAIHDIAGSSVVVKA